MTASHALEGQATDWLRDSENLLVRFGLNDADADARHRNRGAQAHMFTDARLPHLAPDRVFPNLVAVSRGAALSIQIRARSRGPLGFGFRIATGADPVVDRLYAVHRADALGYRSVTVRRFQHEASLITVDLMRARLGHSHRLDALQQLWTCDITTWDVHQFLDPISARVYTRNNPRFPPTPPAGPVDTRRGSARDAAGGPALQVNAGVIWADGSAEQTFERIQVQAEADPDREFSGRLRVHFFVVDPD
ncbi:hypothetical protein GLA29479_2220 [Lysobacter antibioticus]|uniref:hypothetical protein n=1 Tax=Lysobacter antibioticus TaxID=84531 RepID=UPI0007172F77|nr:hypothetical protein [Lysobacter antibioticus]ALN63090.1 hypothetical protein GLA29479_2220 [Lysobacter antibioticus]